jgi:hypothetical protein
MVERCHAHWSTIDSGVNDSSLPIWHRFAFGPNIREALASFKGNIIEKNTRRQIVLYNIFNHIFKILELTKHRFVYSSAIDTTSCTRNRPFQSRIASGICTTFKKALTCESVAYGSCLMKKTSGQKSRVRVPLIKYKVSLLIIWCLIFHLTWARNEKMNFKKMIIWSKTPKV